MKNVKTISERFKLFVYSLYYPKDYEKENIFTELNYDCFTESLELFLIDHKWAQFMIEEEEDELEVLDQMKNNEDFYRAFGKAFRQIAKDLVWTHWD